MHFSKLNKLALLRVGHDTATASVVALPVHSRDNEFFKLLPLLSGICQLIRDVFYTENWRENSEGKLRLVQTITAVI